MASFWAVRNSRERFLIVLALLAGIVGVPMMLISPEKAGGKLLPAAKARQEYKKNEAQMKTLQAETATLKPEIEKLVYKEAPEQVVPGVIKMLQTIAKQSGIHLREIKPLRARRLATVTKVPMTVRFTGQFGQSIPFLYKVEDPNGKLVVEKFNVTTSDPKVKTVDVEVQIALYTQAPPTAKSGDDTGDHGG
jgi:Tfp pilus assembly protein PilO